MQFYVTSEKNRISNTFAILLFYNLMIELSFVTFDIFIIGYLILDTVMH